MLIHLSTRFGRCVSGNGPVDPEDNRLLMEKREERDEVRRYTEKQEAVGYVT